MIQENNTVWVHVYEPAGRRKGSPTGIDNSSNDGLGHLLISIDGPLAFVLDSTSRIKIFNLDQLHVTKVVSSNGDVSYQRKDIIEAQNRPNMITADSVPSSNSEYEQGAAARARKGKSANKKQGKEQEVSEDEPV